MIQSYSKLFWVFSIFLLLGGCRFGNYAEAPKPNFKDGYKSVELFYTQPKRLITIAYYDDNTYHEVANAPLSAIPVTPFNVRDTFTNPVYLAIPNNTTNDPMFVGLSQSTYISTELDPQGLVHYDRSSADAVLWDDPKCLTAIEVAQNGSFDRTQPGSVTFADGSTGTVSGKLKLSYAFYRVFSGACQTDLQRFSYCYTNGAGCDVDELSTASRLLDLYVRQTGALDLSKVSHLKGLSFEVQFE